MNRRAKVRGSWGPSRGSLLVGLWTFALALGVTILSTAVIASLPIGAALLIIMVIVAVGIVFDVIGLATATAREAPFHAMAAKRVHGAAQAITMVRNAEIVSSFCNDLVGDICGTVSGAAAAAIVYRIVAGRATLDLDLLNVVMVSMVAALTVGGKAAGKGFAMAKANEIVHRVAIVVAGWQRVFASIRRALGLKDLRVRPSAQVRTRPHDQEGNRRG